MKKRIFAILLALTLALSLLPTAVFATGEDGAAEVKAAQPADEEQPGSGAPDAEKPEEPAVQSVEQGIAVQAAHTHCFCGGSVTAGDHTSHEDVTYTAWNGTDSISYTSNTAYVYLTGNATINSHLTVDGKTLYLCLNGKTLSSNGTAKIQVKNGGRLVLCDCQSGGTFKGATQDVWGGACIYLYTSTLDMFGGKLTGGKVTGSGGGGAIAMDDQQCIFNMYGGEISGNNGKNYGGAIFRKFNANIPNTTGGNFNMYGGTIKNNTAKNGGAFFSTTGGTINMTGGTISGNKATQNNNDAGGGAIYMRGSGTINISGSAEITGNSSSLDGGAILMGWGTINISGSVKINNNTASRWGGAICLRRDSNQVTTLYMRGGEISGNKATKEGGAVHVLDKDCMFFLYDGKITGNTSGDGGAVYLNQEPSALYMHGGEISGNTATGNGGGVYIYRSGSVCELYGGKIENNKASGNGGGIYINPSNSGQLKVGNTAVVKGNTVSGKANNVYLPSGKTLVIGIGMSTGSSIGVTTADTSYPVAFSNAYAKDYAKCFFADDVNAQVEYRDDQKLYLVSDAVPKPLTVTFDPNGGTLADADKTRSLMTGETYGTLPVPSYEGYDFAGWYTEKTGGTRIEENTTVTVAGTQTLYAHWTPVHVHAYTQQVRNSNTLKTPADCTNDAVYYLSCTCGEISQTDTFTAENTALDHDWGAWTQNSDGSSHTRICQRDANHKENGTCSGGTATCTDKAVCKTCGKEYGEINAKNHTGTLGSWQSDDDNHWKVYSCCNAIISKAAHHGGTATCVSKATCLACGNKYGNIDSNNHVGDTELKGTKAATCTEKGYTGDVYCADCDEKLTVGKDIPALDHDWGAWESNGNDTHTRTCSRDTKHTETNNCSGGTATCTVKAVCDVCNQTYGALKAHDFTAETADAKYLKSGSSCTAEAVYYKSCTVCGLNSKGTASEATFTSGSALGHDWGEPSYTWTEVPDGYMCVAYSKCKNCDADVSDIATVSYAVKQAPTCLNDGIGTYSATFTAVWAAAQTKDETIPALGHDWADATCTAPKTCKVCKATEGTALGHTGGKANCHTKAVCEVCKEEYGEVDAANHDGDTEIKNAKDATCTEKGYTGDTYCKGCNAKLTDGKDIPALGHDWADATCTTPKTCKVCKVTEGTATGHTGGTADCCHKAKCEVCQQEYGEFDPDNHSDLKHFPYKRPTTRAEGNIEYWYCSGCGKYYKDAEATKEITQKDTVIRKRRSTFGSSADDDKTVKSVKTGDAGIALYVGMAALSLTGGAWLRRKAK